MTRGKDLNDRDIKYYLEYIINDDFSIRKSFVFERRRV